MTAADAKSLRLFFAALPDAATRERTAAAAAAMALDSIVDNVPQIEYHVTLAFIGEVPATRLHELREIGRAQTIERFALRFEAYEYWPKPEVVVAAARVIPAALQRLWNQLQRDLALRELAGDRKRLRPHVTLARKVAQAPVLQALSCFDWPVTGFSLMRSDTRGAQARYTVVDTWQLLDNA